MKNRKRGGRERLFLLCCVHRLQQTVDLIAVAPVDRQRRTKSIPEMSEVVGLKTVLLKLAVLRVQAAGYKAVDSVCTLARVNFEEGDGQKPRTGKTNQPNLCSDRLHARRTLSKSIFRCNLHLNLSSVSSDTACVWRVKEFGQSRFSLERGRQSLCGAFRGWLDRSFDSHIQTGRARLGFPATVTHTVLLHASQQRTKIAFATSCASLRFFHSMRNSEEYKAMQTVQCSTDWTPQPAVRCRQNK